MTQTISPERPVPRKGGFETRPYKPADLYELVASTIMHYFTAPYPKQLQVTLRADFSSSNTDTSGGVPLNPSSCHLATTLS